MPAAILDPRPRRVRPGAVLAVLTLVYGFNVVDRYILGLLLPQIKRDIALSDTQLGLISGAAFGIVYALGTVPIARLADQFDRRRIIALSLGAFSLMTALCGTAQTFVQLALARMGVGIGEAGTSPAAYSMIADLYPQERRSSAMAMMTVGSNLGIVLGFGLGGWLATHYGWRLTFVVLGLAGVVAAVLIFALLPEPRRAHAQNAPAPGLHETFVYLFSLKAFRHLLAGNTLMLFLVNATAAWTPSYLVRVHDFDEGQAGLILGLGFGIGGIVGTLALGGWAADHLGARDLRWPAWIAALGCTALVPFQIAFYLAPSPWFAVAAFIVPALLGTFFQGPTMAITQGLAKSRMRATAGACVLLVGSIVGLSLGPVVAGALSDLLSRQFGVRGLGYALAMLSPVGLWAAVHYALAARTLAADLATAAQD